MARADITHEIKIAYLLENYPELEDALMEMAPEFRKLKNPLLRKTIARVTSLGQAAAVAGLPAKDMVNRLRVIANLPAIDSPDTADQDLMGDKPRWMETNQVVITYDASNEIRSGGMPLGTIMEMLDKLSSQQIMLLVSPLLPAPLLDKARQKGYLTWSEKISEQVYNSFILKE